MHFLPFQLQGVRSDPWWMCPDLHSLPLFGHTPRTRHPDWTGLCSGRIWMQLQTQVCQARNWSQSYFHHSKLLESVLENSWVPIFQYISLKVHKVRKRLLYICLFLLNIENNKDQNFYVEFLSWNLLGRLATLVKMSTHCVDFWVLF